jgi:hypothetical protein
MKKTIFKIFTKISFFQRCRFCLKKKQHHLSLVEMAKELHGLSVPESDVAIVGNYIKIYCPTKKNFLPGWCLNRAKYRAIV